MVPVTEINYFKLKDYVVLLNNSGVLDANIDARMKKEELYMKFLEAVDDISEDNPKYEFLPKEVVQFFNICVTNDTMPEEPPESAEEEDTPPEEVSTPESDTDDKVPPEAPPEEEPAVERSDSRDKAKDSTPPDKKPSDKEDKTKNKDVPPPFKKEGKSFEEVAMDLWNEGKTSDDEFLEVFKKLYQDRGKQASDEWFMKRAKIYKGIAKRKSDKSE